MANYVALLRGINVGGKNKIAMGRLRQGFVDLGFFGVGTYINSGNVLFSTEQSDTKTLADLCRAMIAQRFGLDIAVAVFSAQELADALAHAPAWWDGPSAEEMVHQAIFVIAPSTAQEICAAVGECKAEYEQVASHQNVIFWSAARATVGRTRWQKIASLPVYAKVTIRNANTMKKLCALSAEE